MDPDGPADIEPIDHVPEATAFNGPAELSYPDEEGYLSRVDQLMRIAVPNYAIGSRTVRSRMSRGIGDPHQYVLPVVLGRLLIEPEDEFWWDAWRELPSNVYHFRLTHEIPLFFRFEDRVPDDLRAQLVEHWQQFDIWTGGTENHMTQERYNAYLLYERVPELTDEQTLARLREWIREQTQLLFVYGQGEYQSSTYAVYTIAGLLALEQWAVDEDVVAMASAALDWFALTHGHAYYHTVFSGPESRGFSDAPGTGDSTATLWSWFGTGDWRLENAGFSHDQVRQNLPPALATWRPNRIIYNIATNNVELPYSWRSSKPEYYHEYHNYAQEVGYMSENFTMATLYHPYNRFQRTGTIFGQTLPFKLTVRDGNAAATFGVGHEYMPYHAVQGRDPYGQYHQHEGAMIYVAHVADEEQQGVNEDDALRIVHRSVFAAPRSLGEPTERDGWLFYEGSGSYVAAHAVNGNMEYVGEIEGRRGAEVHAHYVSNGRTTGWIVEAAEASDYANFQAFQDAVLNTTAVSGAEDLGEDLGFEYVSVRGDSLSITWNPDNSRPQATTNGEDYVYENWPIFESPYLSIPVESGVLRANDGEWSMTIDYSGDVPEWEYAQLD